MQADYKLLSFLLRGKRRRDVLFNLKEAKMPKRIAQECKISISNVSNSLFELVKEGLAKCITPKEHIYRFYQITERGKKAIKLLEEYKQEKS